MHTNIVSPDQKQFPVAPSISPREAQFSEHTEWDVIYGMRAPHSHSTVREGTTHGLDRKATMVLPLQRCAKLAQKPVLLPWDESTPALDTCIKSGSHSLQPHPAPAPGVPGVQIRGCLAPPSIALSPPVPWLTGQGWHCCFWG